MAMLAEQRRKKKMSVDPRGSNWTNDDSKFGQKLMEKMGWSKGKGLGASEDGRREPVKAVHKTDNRGVGCSKSNADSWIAHQDDFNALLANLSQDHGVGGGGNSSEEDTSRVSSLELKSKTSKGRVHYHKFTKGKDLSLKSSSDLDCVFGKRKSQSESNTPVNQSEANSDASDEEENIHGLRTVKSSDSVQDYFAKKMAEKKLKLSEGPSEGSNDSGILGCGEDIMDTTNSYEEKTVNLHETHEVEGKSKKKSKKSKRSKDETLDVDSIDEVSIQADLEENSNKANSDSILEDRTEKVNKDSNRKKKKKSKKCKKSQLDNDDIDYDVCKEETEISGQNSESAVTETDETRIKKNKKSKKNKQKGEDHETFKDARGKDNKLSIDTEKTSAHEANTEDFKVNSQSEVGQKGSNEPETALDSDVSMSSENIVDENRKYRKSKKLHDVDNGASTKKRKLDDTSETINEINTGLSKKQNKKKKRKNELGRGLYKGKKHFDEGSLAKASSEAFSGSNISKIKGYNGLNEKTVQTGLKRKSILVNDSWAPLS